MPLDLETILLEQNPVPMSSGRVDMFLTSAGLPPFRTLRRPHTSARDRVGKAPKSARRGRKEIPVARTMMVLPGTTWISAPR